MRRLAHLVTLTAATAACACSSGYAPVEHRNAQGLPPPNIEYRNAAPAGAPVGDTNVGAAPSRIVTAQRPAPVTAPPVILPERPDSIVIQPGDTLFAITERYRIGLDQVIAANNLREPYTLVAGRTLILPQWPTYTVREGDTISEIALAARVDMPSLLLLNYIEDPDDLPVGQVLILPELPGGGLDPQMAEAAPAARTPGAAPRPAAAAPAAPAPVTSTAEGRGAPGRFTWPVRGEIISDFGPKGPGQRNDGVNIQANEGDPVRAAAAGEVVYAGNEQGSFGELLLIKHDDGWITIYAHNRRLLVEKGDRVDAGQTIAEAGSTGFVATPQLHFEVRNGTTPVDPMQYLPPS